MTLYVDNSTLKSLATCTTQAGTRYVADWTSTEERAALKAGSAFHEVMESHFTGGSVAESLAVFEVAYAGWSDEHVAKDDRLAYGNIVRILAHWLETHPRGSLPFAVGDPKLVEVPFSIPLVDDIVLCGRLDALVEYQGGYWLLEHKSTGRITADWLKGFYTDSQISTYVWAARQQTHKPVVGAIVNAVEFSKIPGSEGKCKTHKVAYSECGHLHAQAQLAVVERSEEQLQAWHRDAVALARRFQRLREALGGDEVVMEFLRMLPQEGTFHNACRWCEFATWCGMGRPLSYLDGNMARMHWDPRTRGEADPRGPEYAASASTP